MKEPVWVAVEVVLSVHAALIAKYGGIGGVRDAGLLESALARPPNLLAYAEPTLFELAAAYCAGVVRNHPFIDGNKRVGLAVADIFLQLNGHEIMASEPEAVFMIRDLAAGEIDEAGLAAWIAASVEAV